MLNKDVNENFLSITKNQDMIFNTKTMIILMYEHIYSFTCLISFVLRESEGRRVK